jgi:hypothetical protein
MASSQLGWASRIKRVTLRSVPFILLLCIAAGSVTHASDVQPSSPAPCSPEAVSKQAAITKVPTVDTALCEWFDPATMQSAQEPQRSAGASFVRYLSIQGFASNASLAGSTFSMLQDLEAASAATTGRQALVVLVASGFNDFALQAACQQAGLRQVRILRGGHAVLRAGLQQPAELDLRQALEFGAGHAQLVGNFTPKQQRSLAAPERQVRTFGTLARAPKVQLGDLKHNVFFFSDALQPAPAGANIFRVRASSAEFVSAVAQARQVATTAAMSRKTPCYLQ